MNDTLRLVSTPDGPDPSPEHKKSYSISCSSAFRDRILDLATRRGVNAADLARSVMLMLPPEIVAAAADPGGPDREDRETVTLKSGPGKGKPWRRKPRLQVRLPEGYDPVVLRKALGLALDLDAGSLRIEVEPAGQPTREADRAAAKAQQTRLRDENDRLRTALSIAGGDKLGHAVRTKDEALFVLGFAPGSRPDPARIKARFRQLATIHHPDSGLGDTDRMTELNQAMSFMRGYEKH